MSAIAQVAQDHQKQVNDLYWKSVNSSPGDATFYLALGVTFTSLILTSIVTDTIRYYEYFWRSDPIWGLISVALGFCLVVGAFIVGCWQLNRLTQHAYTDYINVLDSDQRINIVMSMISLVIAWQAATYYSWRCYRLSGNRRWVLGAFSVCAATIFIFAMYVFGRALGMPKISLETLDIVQAYIATMRSQMVVVGWLPVGLDLTICITTITLLSRTRSSLVRLEKSLFKRIVSYVFESMLPPTLCLSVFTLSAAAEKSDFTQGVGWRRVLSVPIPALYFHSLLHTLVSRRVLRDLLNQNLADQGIDRIAGSGRGFHSREGSDSHTTYPPRVFRGDRSLTPSVHIKVDSISTTYASDKEAAGSYGFGAKSINRDATEPVVFEADEERGVVERSV